MLRVGIAGAGGAAEIGHLPGYLEDDRTTVVAIADHDEERSRRFAQEYSIPSTYADAEAMIAAEELDIVSICTPPETHETIFISAVEHDCAVFCEKPLTTSVESARRMRDAVREHGVVSQIGYVPRYFDNYRRVRSIVTQHLLGDVQTIQTAYFSPPPPQDWYFDSRVSGGGVIMDKLPHVLDFYMELFDELPTVERCQLRREDGQVERAADIDFSFGETNVRLSIGWTQPEFFSEHIAVGDEGRLTFNNKHLDGNVSGANFHFKYGQHPVVDLKVKQFYVAKPADAHARRIRDFVDQVAVGEQRVSASVERGFDVASVIESSYEEGSES